MTAVPAIKTDLRRELVRALQQDIVFQVQAGDDGDIVKMESIVFQKTRLQRNREFEKSNQELDFPAIVVCEPIRDSVLPTEWTMGADLWHYRYLIQISDKADLWAAEDRIATWEKWTEQIISYLQFSCLNEIVQLPKGQIVAATATPVQAIDETMWIKDSQFISGIDVEVRVAQPRGLIV